MEGAIAARSLTCSDCRRAPSLIVPHALPLAAVPYLIAMASRGACGARRGRGGEFFGLPAPFGTCRSDLEHSRGLGPDQSAS